MSPRYAFPRVSVAGRPPIDVCVDLDAGDVVAPWLLEHDWIDEPVQRLFLDFVAPGARVLDLGSHLGLFSLPAAALGAQVLAVDATPAHAEQLRLAAERGGLGERVRVVHALIADGSEPLPFVERSIHGHVRVGHVRTGEEEDHDATVELVPVTVDALLADAGWDGLDVVKIDIEGLEPAALRGMEGLFARGSRPVLVFEGNGGMLRIFGSSPQELLHVVIAQGYDVLQVDHLHPGTLIPVTVEHVQPECVVDYLAVPRGFGDLPGAWTVRAPLTREETVTRMIDQAAVDAWGFRRWVADALADGPDWLRDDPLTAPLTGALERDLDHRVRLAAAALAPSRAGEAGAAAAPQLDGDLLVMARDVTVAADNEWLARAPGQPGAPAATVRLRGVSLHIRRGELLGVLARVDDERAALVELLAGWAGPASGTLARTGTALALSRIARIVEPDFTVVENLVVLAAFLGADSASVAPRATEFAERAELDADLDTPLSRLAVADIARLAVVVALDDPQADLIVLDDVPATGSEPFAEWLRVRTSQLRDGGVAFVHTATTPDELVGTPDRLVWLGHGRMLAAGHPRSVADAALRDALGLGREQGALR